VVGSDQKCLHGQNTFMPGLYQGGTSQNGHVVIVVGTVMILVHTDFMGFTVGRRGTFVLLLQFMIFRRMLLSMWPDVCGW